MIHFYQEFITIRVCICRMVSIATISAGRLDLADPIRLQNKTTWTREHFVGVYLHCRANARIVDSELNAPGPSTFQWLAKGSWQGVREGHWSDLAVHCGLFAGPARSLFVAAYRIDGSQGELSWLAVELSRTSVKLGMPWKRRVIFSIARDWFVTHATFTTKVGVSFVYHMADDALEVDSFSSECYQALSSARF